MSNLQERIRAAIQASHANLGKFASEVDSAETKTPEVAATGTPEELQGSAASDVTVDSVPLMGNKGETTPSGIAEEGGIDVTNVEETKDGEAAAALDIKEGTVTEEDIDVLNKAANAVRSIGARLMSADAFAMNKYASAEDDAVTIMYKRASAGDPSAQACLDWMASFELGMQKKANDMAEAAEATGAESEEDLEDIEDTLNASAMEDPELLGAEGDMDIEDFEDIDEDMEEGDVEDLMAELEANPELMAEIQEAGAAIEEAMGEEVETLAEEIMAEDPEVSEEEAYEVAAEHVLDAVETVDAQQLIGAADEDGEPVVSDEDAVAAADEMVKTASAYPLRDVITARLNARLCLNPEGFAQRLFG